MLDIKLSEYLQISLDAILGKFNETLVGKVFSRRKKSRVIAVHFRDAIARKILLFIDAEKVEMLLVLLVML